MKFQRLIELVQCKFAICMKDSAPDWLLGPQSRVAPWCYWCFDVFLCHNIARKDVYKIAMSIFSPLDLIMPNTVLLGPKVAKWSLTEVSTYFRTQTKVDIVKTNGWIGKTMFVVSNNFYLFDVFPDRVGSIRVLSHS
ncbi:hypothetical protein Agabi119p4_8471 [Agaricus bisporus var. burnettii]|uniref:Uncharacterized protein n=1 Tax=Agaricus bisporus var. burnettii TaxID=192524 RepID=A0A8H7EZ07_AGABI|nr:hypothetical protein Agabi119p4_8471 [Agaricus bisporus var. burnettii]